VDDLLYSLRKAIFGTQYPEKTFSWDTNRFHGTIELTSTEFYVDSLRK
jgi:hypothetical protein